MRLHLLFILVPAAAALALSPQSRVSLRETNVTGSFDVLVDGAVWFPAGAPTSVRQGGKDYSAGDGSLKLVSQAEAPGVAGIDSLGAFKRMSWGWSAGGLNFTTSARIYASSVVFEQEFTSAMAGTSMGDVDGILSSFPSLGLPANATDRDAARDAAPPAPARGYLQYNGDMVGSGYHVGQWDPTTGSVGSGIKGTAPLCIFGVQAGAGSSAGMTSVVLSPLSNAMATSQYFKDGSLSYGVMGNVTDIPQG